MLGTIFVAVALTIQITVSGVLSNSGRENRPECSDLIQRLCGLEFTTCKSAPSTCLIQHCCSWNETTACETSTTRPSTGTTTTVGATTTNTSTTIISNTPTNPSLDDSNAQSHRSSCNTERKDGVCHGLAIGLLFVGMTIGVVVTCLLCICVPTLNKKATSLLCRRQLLKSKKDIELDTRITPSSPQKSFKAEYESNMWVKDQRESHIYAGIETETPLPDEGQKAQGNQPNKVHIVDKFDAVTSPVYNVVSVDVQSSVTKGPSADYHQLNDNRADDTYRQLEKSDNGANSSIPDEPRVLEGEGDEPVNHNYFTLNQQNVSAVDTPYLEDDIDSTAHAYFVFAKDP